MPMTIQAVLFDTGGTIETLFHDDELRLAATVELRQQLVERSLDPGLAASVCGRRKPDPSIQ